jgi:hypothetical protein
MTQWIETFKQEYYPHLNQPTNCIKRGVIEGLYYRADGFKLMFEELLKHTQDSYKIIETGTMRNPGNWKDGQSAFLFTEFVKAYGGTVRSVDINQEACNTSRAAIESDAFTVTCSDSVAYLQSQSDLDEVDLFYLDSYDVKWRNDEASAEHHLKEFQSIEQNLKPGAVVAIDDNTRLLEDNRRTGKGRRIVEYLESKGIRPIYDQYQIIYIW